MLNNQILLDIMAARSTSQFMMPTKSSVSRMALHNVAANAKPKQLAGTKRLLESASESVIIVVIKLSTIVTSTAEKVVQIAMHPPKRSEGMAIRIK
jgi:hypothetical protein